MVLIHAFACVSSFICAFWRMEMERQATPSLPVLQFYFFQGKFVYQNCEIDSQCLSGWLSSHFRTIFWFCKLDTFPWLIVLIFIIQSIACDDGRLRFFDDARRVLVWQKSWDREHTECNCYCLKFPRVSICAVDPRCWPILGLWHFQMDDMDLVSRNYTLQQLFLLIIVRFGLDATGLELAQNFHSFWGPVLFVSVLEFGTTIWD